MLPLFIICTVLRTSLVFLGIAVTDAAQLFHTVVHALHKSTEPLQALLTASHTCLKPA